MQPQNLPPGPRSPSLYQMLQWAYRPIQWMERCHRRYGDCFTLRAPSSPPMVFISDPGLIKQIFAAPPSEMAAGRANIFLKPLLGPNSLLVLDGEAHMRQRKLLLGPMHGERMHAYGAAMARITAEHIDRWPRGETFALQRETQSITLAVILETVFGVGAGEHEELQRLLKQFMELGAESPLNILMLTSEGEIRGQRIQKMLGRFAPLERLEQLLTALDRQLYQEIARRRAQADARSTDVLGMLVQARDEAGAPMSDQEIRDELLTLLVAGHETTATSLTFVVQSLLETPAVLGEIQAELDRVDGSRPLCERVGELTYLDAVIKEALRLRPVAPVVGRVLTAPVTLGRWQFPQGVMLVPCVYLTHRRADLWPAPERFDPRRFLDGRHSPAEYFPFGGGNRRCIGAAFATYEMKIVLAEMLRRIVPLPAPGYRMRIIRRGFTLAPSERLPVRVQNRA